MRLLITNDDGVDAPGLQTLARSLEHLGEVWVVAPEREQSARSHAFTLHKPLRVTQRSERVFSLSGTPADCAYAGIHGLVPKPDLVISGINRGANLGSDVHYSGTVGAAREAFLQGVPSVAVSLCIRSKEGPRHYEHAARIAGRTAQDYLKSGIAPTCFLNINVPNIDPSEMRGVKAARLGRRKYTTVVHEHIDPRGRRLVWLGGRPTAVEPIPESDVDGVAAGYATVTPLNTEPTVFDALEAVDGWF